MITHKEEADAFLAACQSCSRKEAKHLPTGSNPLLDTNLKSFATNVLTQSHGRLVDVTTPFHATIWKHGATHVGKTSPGVAFKESIGDFVKLLEWRATQVASKRSGWVVEPTTNRDGIRTNESTESLHAIFLDADNAGGWEATLENLSKIGIAHIAYQSGGWTSKAPKWRIVIPLEAHFLTPDAPSRDTWKTIYLAIRVLVGAVGDLTGYGFDPATDTPCCPWFLTEKRDVADPQREVLFRPGASLDILRLAMDLPSIKEDNGYTETSPRPKIERIHLVETRFEEIVSALIRVTADVHTGRRSLYLALPGVLLDRGIAPDDVIDICEEISGAYHGGDEVKHADNVRSAKTTAAKWESTGIVTRIGSLNRDWPTVAQVLDEVLPDEWAKMMREKLERDVRGVLGINTSSPPLPPLPPMPPLPPSSYTDAVDAEKTALAVNLPPLPPTATQAVGGSITTAQMRQIIRKKRNAKEAQSKFDADMIENFMAGEKLVTEIETVKFPQLSKFDGEEGLLRIAWILGNNVPNNVSWDAIINIRPQGSRVPFSRDMLSRAGIKFEAAKKKRVEYNKKKEAEKEAERAAFHEHVKTYGARMKARKTGQP